MKKATKIKKYAKEPKKFKEDLGKKHPDAWLILGIILIILAIISNLLWFGGLVVLIYVVYLWVKSRKKKKG